MKKEIYARSDVHTNFATKIRFMLESGTMMCGRQMPKFCRDTLPSSAD
jgi:hypothetical protein